MDYKKYIQAWREKLTAEQKERLSLRKDALRTASSISQILVKEYKARQIYLFGSLARGYDFMRGSDIDLAVEGLNGIRYFEAVGHLSEGKEFIVNIVPLEDCPQDLKGKIMKEGRLLYGGTIRGETKTPAS